jgi:hypothetical protein
MIEDEAAARGQSASLGQQHVQHMDSLSTSQIDQNIHKTNAQSDRIDLQHGRHRLRQTDSRETAGHRRDISQDSSRVHSPGAISTDGSKTWHQKKSLFAGIQGLSVVRGSGSSKGGGEAGMGEAGTGSPLPRKTHVDVTERVCYVDLGDHGQAGSVAKVCVCVCAAYLFMHPSCTFSCSRA